VREHDLAQEARHRGEEDDAGVDGNEHRVRAIRERAKDLRGEGERE
jgi:hypothetical protein